MPTSNPWGQSSPPSKKRKWNVDEDREQEFNEARTEPPEVYRAEYMQRPAPALTDSPHASSLTGNIKVLFDGLPVRLSSLVMDKQKGDHIHTAGVTFEITDAALQCRMNPQNEKIEELSAADMIKTLQQITAVNKVEVGYDDGESIVIIVHINGCLGTDVMYIALAELDYHKHVFHIAGRKELELSIRIGETISYG